MTHAPAQPSARRLPLTLGQRRILALARRQSGDPAYHHLSAVRLAGRLDEAALHACLRQVVDRHDSLRASFPSVDGETSCCIAAAGHFVFRRYDLSALGEAAQQKAIERVAREETRRPFNLDTGPLFRASLLFLAPDSRILVLCFHHLIMDGWSLGIFVQDVAACYKAHMMADAGPPMARAPSAYGMDTYVAEALAASETARYAESLDYWSRHLPSLKWSRLPATFEHTPSTGRPRQGRTLRTRFGDVRTNLDAAARKLNVTRYQLLLTAFLAHVADRTHCSDVAVTTLLANRASRERQSLIGFLANTVILRHRFDEGEAWPERVAGVTASVRDMMRHGEVSLYSIAHRVAHILDQTPSILFTLQNNPLPPMRLADVELSMLDIDPGSAKFDLSVYLAETDSGLDLWVEFDTGLYSLAAMERFVEGYRRALDSLCEAILVPASAMTDKAQPLRLEGEPVAALTGAALPASNRLSLPQALLACIRRRPADIALEADGHCISFAQFGRDIGQILTGLERLGARSGDRVAVLGERNRATLATLWACLFAGFTYVPLALDMPPARLQQIVRDAAPDWLLSDRDDACAIGGWHNVTDWLAPDTAAACADPLPTPRCVPDALPAYLLYTSGSTGTPKGVLVTRASLDAFCTAMDPVIPKAEQAVWLAVSSLSFDISILELLWASSRGFRVRIGSIAQLCLGNETSADTAGKLPDLGLFFFGNTEQYGAEEHLSMLLEANGWADRNGFSTAWTPERHFGSFGGFFSNPGLLAAYLLARTERISIRAGSVLGPLHLTPRLAEDWATLDRLGQGRAGLSIAAGWNPADFVLAQRPLAERSDVVAQQLIDLRALWRGDAVPFPDPNGRFFDIRLALRQNSPLPLSMTVSHRPEQFEAAAEQGVDVLTHLLEQDMAQLAGHIERYRQAWQRHHGENSRPGRVTVMIHSFVGSDDDAATAQALPLLMRYLANAGSALRSLSTAVPDGGAPIEPELLEAAARRLISERSLICGPRSAQQRLRRLYRIGVDEVANLVDFGLPAADILASLERLGEVRDAPHGRAPAQAPVTHFQCTPSAARLLLRQPGGLSSRLNHLACWLVGGEALDDDLLRQLRLASDAPLYNVYGPTEATVWASVASIDARRSGPVSIGTPLPGTEIYLLDDRCQPVPQGVLGQLHIGGSGVAQGYWAQPATTAAAFIPSPFGPPGARLYATGDWARLTNDGTLAFAGRRDTQVKISGHRVDLAGMREVLLQHGAVADAWVHAFPGTDEAAMSVVAFVVPSTDGDASLVNALHDHLALHWEVGVVPRHIVVLDELPLTLSQKMDLRRLGDLYRRFLAEHKHPDALPAEDALAGAMLQTLRSLWQAILPAFDGHADFHRAGGNSLLAMQLLARANAQFNVQTSLLEFYRAPTLRGHWKAVQEATRRAGGITLAPVPRVGVYPVSFAQRAMLILDHMSAAHSSYHDDVTLRLNGQLSPDALRVAYASLLQRHRLFTTAYRFGKEDYEQVWLDDVAPDFRLATLEHAGAMDEVLRDFRDEPFDLSGGKVIRALLLQLAPTQHVLCVAVHHIASDGATLRLILDELLVHYRRCMAGSPPAATPAHWQYVDFVDWQRRRLAARQGELEAFWDTQLARRQAEPPAQAGKRDAAPVAAEWAVEIPGAQTHLVEALARRFQVGELTVLLAPLCLVLEQPGSGVTTIATDARNRERTEFEAVPGMMVNQILLPIQLPAAGDLRDLLQACNHQLVQCLGHQEFPYERLASRWHKRSPDFDAPLFDVKLVLNDPRRDVQVEGLQVEEYRIAARVAKFGILVNLQRDGHRYTGTIVFDSSRHHREAVRALWADYLAALEQLPELTDVREVRRNLATRREERSRALQSGRLAPLQAARRRAAAPASALLRTFPASDDCPVPRIEPARAEQPLAPALLPERRRIVELVRQHGAALLRGFSQVTPATLDEVVQALCGSPLPYVERSTPRTELGNKLYSATEYPAHQGIELHNENSYAAQWPGTLFFWCARPAVAGGENLLADSRRILELIPQDLAHKFELGGVLYRRELGPPLGMAWQYVFQCSTPEEVERIGHASGYNVRWHSAERVTLSRHGQAVATHPFTGERSWFNHALFFHESSLPDEIRGGLRKLYGDDYLPHQSFHGDGSSISSGEAALLRRAYRSCERTLLLHKDDILIIDNLLVAHGRCAFTGPRDIRLMMGQTMA